MRLTTELEDSKQKILIIEQETSELAYLIKEAEQKYGNDVFISPKPPTDLSQYDVCFFVNEPKRMFETAIKTHHQKLIFIFLDHKRQAEHCVTQVPYDKKHRIKIINIEGDPPYQAADVEKVFWFIFSQTHEVFFNLQRTVIKQPVEKPLPQAPSPSYQLSIMKYIRLRTLPIYIFAFLLAFHFFFIPPLMLASYYYYQSVLALQQHDLTKTSNYMKKADISLSVGKKLYSIIRPTYLLFSVAIYPDNYFQLDETIGTVLKKTVPLYDISQQFVTLLFKKNKTADDVHTITYLKNQLNTTMTDIDEYVNLLGQQLPTYTPQLAKAKDDLKRYSVLLDTGEKIMPNLDAIMGADSPKTYLLMFANNMELRPGGGFIGSFGIAKVSKYTIDDLTIYDVYDADGQLKAHIDPPEPIRKYLQQPHWFLRDSAFSPDFVDNYTQAKFFLQKEMGLDHFDGAFLLTTTAIRNLLEPMGNLYLPDFHERVNKDNFYLKAQLYAEKDFFPGSTQKKRFLGAVTTQMLINSEKTSLPALMLAFKKSFDEKQMIMYFEDEKLQNNLNSLLWSGKMLNPECPTSSKNCVVDYLFPVDANLGVNKANFFVYRQNDLAITFDSNGVISNRYKLLLRNSSNNDVFPGGVYRNYFQLVLPSGSRIKQITVNGTLVDEYDERNDLHKTVGFFVQVKPQGSAEVVVDYLLTTPIKHGRGAYQLVVQKQIGSTNSDLHLTVKLPNNIYTVDKNFSPLVKDNTMIYNTSLSADKVFFIELFKD